MPPDYLVQSTFLGQSCGTGVNPTLWAQLQTVEAALQQTFNDDPQKINPATGQPTTSFTEWCFIVETHIGWRPHAGFHSSGSAIDINTSINPYIVTRTGDTLGGEAAGASLVDMRQRAVAVYDRAMQFFKTPSDSANVSNRGPNESTSDVYDRFYDASTALIFYLTFVINPAPTRVNRVAIENAEDATNDTLDSSIPGTELRIPKDQAVAQLQTFMASNDFQQSHPNWPNDAEAQYYRILRDYELVRIPMVIGNPSATPQLTRNPAQGYGFLNLRKEVVVALCDTGKLRWGICDFGPQQSGDVMHFDLGNDGGYPRVNS